MKRLLLLLLFLAPSTFGQISQKPFPGQDLVNNWTNANFFTGPVTCKRFENVRCVDSSNSAGWSGADACAWINSAIADLPTITQGSTAFPSGVVDFRGLASTSVVTCGSTWPTNGASPYLTLIGPGSSALIFNCTMNADCFFAQGASGAQNIKGFRASGFSLLGQGSGNANANGIHTGDLCGSRFEDIQVSGFSGASSSGIWVENKNFFFEDNIFINVASGAIPGATSLGNTKDFRFSINASAGSTNASFAGNTWIVKYNAQANQTAFSWEGGTTYNGVWMVKGNTNSATGSTVIAMSGSTFPSSGVNTQVSGVFVIQTECTGCSGAQFYNIPANYAFITVQGSRVDGASGFNYSTGVSGLVQNRLNASPLSTPYFLAYDATGNAQNQYNISVVNPASNRKSSLKDPGSDFIFGTTINSGSGGYASLRASGCTTAASIGGVCATAVTITLPNAGFPTTNYSAGCTPEGTPTNLPSSPFVVGSSKTTTTFQINYYAITAAAASWPTLDCWAILD